MLQGITVDNADENTNFMQELQFLLPEFDSENQHFRCIGQIINFAAQDLLTTLKPVEQRRGGCKFNSEDEFDSNAEKEETEKTCVEKEKFFGGKIGIAKKPV